MISLDNNYNPYDPNQPYNQNNPYEQNLPYAPNSPYDQYSAGDYGGTSGQPVVQPGIPVTSGQPGPGLGIASMIVGAFAIIFSLIYTFMGCFCVLVGTIGVGMSIWIDIIGLVLGITATILGAIAKKTHARGNGFSTAGLILGIISVVLGACSAIFYVVLTFLGESWLKSLSQPKSYY